MLAKTLYLMRHGQTLFNFKGLIQGFGDSPLTELGIAQAQKARSYYETKGINFDLYASSTQERASDTLENVAPNQSYQRFKGLKDGILDYLKVSQSIYLIIYTSLKTYSEIELFLSKERQGNKLKNAL